MALHVISDSLIALSYFAIPIGIAVFVRRRSDLNAQHKLIALLFAIFIAACGLTHVFSIVVLWAPYYAAEGLLKAFTALVSVGTALALPFLLPQLLKIPSPRVLQAEIDAHRRTLDDLEMTRKRLLERVIVTESENSTTNRRFEAALKGSQVTVLEQDEDLRVTWAYNLGLGLDLDRVIGSTEDEFLTPESAAELKSIKSSVLSTGNPIRASVNIATRYESGWFDIRIERINIDETRRGIVVTSTDISDLKRQEEHLRIVMRELNHRTKNLLTIVMSLTRQTSRSFEVPEAFAIRLQERLAALASAHDELARQEWKGAELKAVIEGQLRYQMESFADRIEVIGPDFRLPAEAAHYVGMAIHELGSNAVKHGALSSDQGEVRVTWHVDAADAKTLTLEWTEIGGPFFPPPTKLGFGSTILRHLTARALEGSAELDFLPSGVRWKLIAPLVGAEP